MMTLLRALLATVVLLCTGTTGFGKASQEKEVEELLKKLEKAAAEHDLKQLGEKDHQLLKKNGFVITGQSYRQIFTPYLGDGVPFFITSDSLLNAFHVLFEESIYRMELAQARKLPGILDTIAKDLDAAGKLFLGDADLIAAARKREEIFLGTARHLLDEKALPSEEAIKKAVQEEVQRVVAAKGVSKPAWLGPPDDGFLAIDYTRFQPRGFYMKTPALQRYFRAVNWLQAIPFRLDRDEELAAFILMRLALGDPEKKETVEKEQFWRAYRAFLGTEDDWDLPTADLLPGMITKAGLDNVRKQYRERATSYGQPQINDQLRFAPLEAGGKIEPSFRFLSAYRLADAVMFHRTMNPELAKRNCPSGLEVSAALGSPFARDRLKREYPKVVQEIDRCRPLFKEKGLYSEYLRCLSVLLERTEPDAPALFHGEAWKVKTCQTALASWAQMRHTWALQAKQSARYLSASRSPAGFVEPVPEFYTRMTELLLSCQERLAQAGALAPRDRKELIAEWKQAQTLVQRAKKQKKGLASLTMEERRLLAQFVPELNNAVEDPGDERVLDRALEELSDMIRLVGSVDDRYASEMLEELGFGDHTLAPKWDNLIRICRQLERLAHKQLRQVPFSDREDDFVRHYGKQLAGVMFYGGNSYSKPRDDAPRIVDVFSNGGKHLLVGTGRAREIWVRYPFKGKDILCRGAVLPYHEFAHPERLTNHAWKSLLDSPRRPEQPEWVRPVTVPERPRKQ